MPSEGQGLPVIHVKFACADQEEFRRKFEATLLGKGMVARAATMYPVGARVRLKLELQNGTIGVDEEAVVQSVDTSGGKPAMHLHLARALAPAPKAPSPEPAAPPRRVATGAFPAASTAGEPESPAPAPPPQAAAAPAPAAPFVPAGAPSTSGSLGFSPSALAARALAGPQPEPPPEAPPRWRKWFVAGLAAGTVAAGALVYFRAPVLAMLGFGPAAAPPAAEVAAAPAPPAEPPPAPAPAAEEAVAEKPPAPPPPEAPAAGPVEVKLTIETSPPGAMVVANGKRVGKTPLKLPWKAGEPVRLRFFRVGHKPETQQLRPEADATVSVTLQKDV